MILDAVFCAGTAWAMARAAAQPVKYRFIGKDMQRIWILTVCLLEAIQPLLVPQTMICKVSCRLVHLGHMSSLRECQQYLQTLST